MQGLRRFTGSCSETPSFDLRLNVTACSDSGYGIQQAWAAAALVVHARFPWSLTEPAAAKKREGAMSNVLSQYYQ